MSIVLSVFSVLGVGSTIAFARNNGNGSSAMVGGNLSDSIGAVANAASGEEVLDPVTVRMVRALNVRSRNQSMPGLRLTGEARVLPRTVDGKHVYVLPTDNGALCVLVEADTEVCGPPLSAARPASVTTLDSDGPGGAGATVIGVAMDGVTTISLTVNGAQIAVPVRENLFVFHGSSAMTLGDFSRPTASFADGRTVRLS
ncbi:MAG: hypothetical protein H0V22_11250 [Solirubrobacterales bacterium]|nr:hypothetical protein [Solirubrobacterales bacterium]